MPSSRKSSKKAERVVRRTLADGTVKEYRYAPYRRKPKRRPLGDTVGDLIAAWERSPAWRKMAPNTRAGYLTYLRPLMGMQHVLAARVERRELIAIRDALAQAKGDGAATGFVRTASALFGWAVKNGWLPYSPCTKIERLSTGHLPAWKEHEAATAIEHLPERLRRAVVLALYTGQRRGDLVALRWGDYEGDRIRLLQKKTGAELVIPVHPVLKAELDEWRSGPIAPLPTASVLTTGAGTAWRPSNLSNQLQDALAKIPGFPSGRNIHGLRKLAAAQLAEAGCTLHEIGALTGHKTLAMLQLYTASASQERLAKSAFSKLNAKTRKRDKNQP